MNNKDIHKENKQKLSVLTPRQALIYAAAEGWQGDDPSPWISPAAVGDILAWAKSHISGQTQDEDFSSAFDELVLEGLFFEIHQGLFDPPCYYCSFDTDFLKEIPDGSQWVDFWDDWVQRYDEEHGFKTWRRMGLCAGQGSQGPSDAPWGPCLGPSCCWFEDGDEQCNHELRFIKGLKVVCKGCGQDVIREQLTEFPSGIWSRGSSYAHHPHVCPHCTKSHNALKRLCKQYGDVDHERSLQEFKSKWL